MINIDGSVLEGGGQILRIALSLSAILRKPVKISKIRAGRSKPGLAAQHLKGFELLGEICKANLKGATLGSTEIEFHPSTIQQGSYYADPRTAGCISLLVQIVLPVTYFANGPIVLELKGGTNCIMAPQIDFTTEVFRPNLEKFGCSFDFDLKRRGYFPRGGGHCVINIRPVKQIAPVNITNFGQVQKFYGWSFVAGSLPVKVAQEMADGAQRSFTRSQSQVRDINVESYKEDPSMATDNCSGIVLVCETSTKCVIGGSGLGNRNERANETGAKAASEILKALESQACVDEHVQDQLIIFMALASGESQIRCASPLTLHTQTAIYIAESMTQAKFETIEEGKTILVKCKGIGAKNESI